MGLPWVSHSTLIYTWRLRWKKGARIFTQNWTLSKTLQISHAVLFRCVKQCSVSFFAEVFFVYEILRMQKSLYLWSHKHVTGKTVISLKIQQNIVLQRVTLESVDFRVKPLQFWFHVNVRPQRRYNFDFTLTCDRKDVNFTQITTQK